MTERRASFDARGLGIYLVLLTQLITFGFAADTGRVPTPVEILFLEAARKDLSREEAADLQIKRRLLEALL